ncbi:MAG: methylenetetrahydrofolate reductase [Rickettsiales bacterium]
MNQKNYKHIKSLKALFACPPQRVSFEFFPPKTTEMEDKLWQSIKLLAPLSPHFVSVTYGAGGTTRERTHATIRRLKEESNLVPAAHLTCVGASRGEIDEVAKSYWDLGVRHIVALRGDPPEGQKTYTPHPDGYAYASDLVEGLRKIGDFEISVAAYPEMHPEAADAASDLDNLKRKVDAGANRVITQFFFDVEVFLRFYEKVLAAGINVPIVPGILPISNFGQVKRFAGMCGATVPDWIGHLFEGLDDNPDFRHLIAVSIAAEQTRLLRQQGIEDFHFYTLNRARLTLAICHILGIRAAGKSDCQ